jgi:uncharacterized protein (TIGR02996 family)
VANGAGVTMREVRSFRLVDPARGKFWEVHWEGLEAETATGKLGTNGRSRRLTFERLSETEAYIEAQVALKRKEGFVEMSAVADPTTAPQAAASPTLLEQIQAHPEDDALRLVLADQLAQEGDPLGELINVQVALSGDPAGPQAALLKDREKDLLDRFRSRWSGGLRGVDLRFERGFAVEARLNYVELEAAAPRLFEVAPLLHTIHVSTDEGYFYRDEIALAVLGKAPHLERLRALHINGLNSDAATVLLPHEGFRGLRTLSIRRGLLSDDRVVELLTAPHLQQLTELDFRANLLEGHAVEYFVRRPLTTLKLANNRLRRVDVERLANAELLSGLTVLDLSGNWIGDDGVRALAASAHLGKLAELGLANTGASAAGLATLTFPSLRALDVSGNKVGVQGVAALLSGSLPSLESLELAEAHLGDEGLRALLASPGAGTLRSLDLKKNALSPEAAQLLADSHALPNLAYLSLSGNPIGAAAAKLLQKSPHYAKTQLVLRLIAPQD